MNKYLLLLLMCLTCMFSSLAAHNLQNESEFDSDNGVIENSRSFVETLPPVGPVRPVGEFEPASQVLIRYPLGIPVNLVVQFSNVIQVVCLVGSTSTQNQATSSFQSAGVNMNNVVFMIAPTDTYWTRDYGPFFIFDGNNELGIVDFPYNRPRPNDDEIPRTFAFTYDYPLYGMNITNTGGNYMSDSVSGAAQTTLVYSENSSQTQQQIQQKMHDYMGIDNYHVLQDPNGDYIEHIDCWGKFLAPDKILIRSVPSNHSQYSEIESVASYFTNNNCAWGYPYKVFRIYSPQNQPYTNSLILNNNVFVPIMNNANDSAALQVYQNALPGYNIVGIAGAGSTPWQSTDALHCRAHEIPDRDMLYINHMPYHGETTLQNYYDFNTNIIAYSNQPVYDDSLLIVYKVNQGQWQSMLLANIIDNMYTTIFSGLAPGDTMRYFIHAADQSGHSINHPMTGALDPHIFWLAPDNIPPVITHSPLTVLDEDELPVTILAQVTDNYGVGSVQVVYRFDDGQENSIEMESAADDFWMAIFSPEIPQLASHFFYKIIASDNSNPANVSYTPISGWYDAVLQPTTNSDLVTPADIFSLNMIYPNPFRLNGSKNLTVAYSAKVNQQVRFNLYNVKGQLLQSFETITGTSGNQNLTLKSDDLKSKNLSNGIYYLQMQSGETSIISKILILK